MTTHSEMQNRLKSAIQEAILNEGRIEGTDDMTLTNTDVVEVLAEVMGFYASFRSFEDYTPTDLAFQHTGLIWHYIEKYRSMREKGKLPYKFIPRRKVN